MYCKWHHNDHQYNDDFRQWLTSCLDQYSLFLHTVNYFQCKDDDYVQMSKKLLIHFALFVFLYVVSVSVCILAAAPIFNHFSRSKKP